jgi:uncharacterized membrane protein YraQ (UPF0718 family)/copper chaperone CopZ
MFEDVYQIALESFALFAAMAPYLLLGTIVAGAMHVLMPVGTISRHFGKPGVGSVFKASALGIPLPLCSCGVVPVAASLKYSGATKGAVVGFLVTTPTSGVDSILATYSLLGGALAIIRVVVSFIVGLAAGITTALGLGKKADASDTGPIEIAVDTVGVKKNIISSGLSYGFGELFGGIARPLLIGTILGGIITYYFPPGIFQEYVGQGLISYLILLAVGIPLYVCASGSIPFAAALIAKGISPGAALIFLIAGPATNAATVSIVYNLLGRKTLFIYLSYLIFGSLAAGYATDLFFTQFPSLLPDIVTSGHHHMQELSWLEISSGALLGIFTFYHLAQQLNTFIRKHRHQAIESDGLVLKVEGMSCQGCVKTITNAVKPLPGVRDVKIDLATKIVDIDMDDPQSFEKTEAIIEEIEKAGYQPKRN